MCMLRYKFREAADLQGGGRHISKGGGSPKCSPGSMCMCICICEVRSILNWLFYD